jgi:predicted transcriptional regulator
MLYEFIKKNLGTHFSLIRSELAINREEKNVSPGRLIWHLEMLLKFNFIKKVKIKNYTLFLPSEVTTDEGIIHFILRDEVNYKIINKILESNLIKVADIYKEIEEKRELVYYRVNNLIELEILLQKDADNKAVMINPKIKKTLKNVIGKNNERK